MKKMTLLLTLLALMLSACIPQNAAIEKAVTQETEPTITATSAPAATEADSLVDQLLSSYLAGEAVNISTLSPEEFTEFSSRLAEKLNADRGINPVIYNNESYISPDDFMMMNYDGHPDMNETIIMYYPIDGVDENGNLQININGKTITIQNSANTDWNLIVNDPNDTRINWPTLPIIPARGMNEAQWYLSPTIQYKSVLRPLVLLDKSIGQFYLSGDQSFFTSSLKFLLIETDTDNHAILARVVLSIPAFEFNLFEENSGLDVNTPGLDIPDYCDFYKTLEENTVYYVSATPNEEAVISEGMKSGITNYSGIIHGIEAINEFSGEGHNNQDLILLLTKLLIMKK
jgi:hypothetical protein